MIDLIGRLRVIRQWIESIYAIGNAIFRLNETGGTLDPAALNTEYTLCIINTPLGSFKPLKVKIDTREMTWGDTTIVKWWERIESGGDWVEKDEEEFDGPQDIVPLSPMKNIHLEPNRFGIKITLEQKAGTLRDYPWEWFYNI